MFCLDCGLMTFGNQNVDIHNINTNTYVLPGLWSDDVSCLTTSSWSSVTFFIIIMSITSSAGGREDGGLHWAVDPNFELLSEVYHEFITLECQDVCLAFRSPARMVAIWPLNAADRSSSSILLAGCLAFRSPARMVAIWPLNAADRSSSSILLAGRL
ncbi:hypothetical protein QE152_g24363 [Popillia japonica]|uniref:Uncharacterized protein n=1 Tax=Popillia japonica TaxID=7064 RepID=A0AAW1KFU9_POPJA